MSLVVACLKPTSCSDWSYYCQLELNTARTPYSGPAKGSLGLWRYLRGPYFPFTHKWPDQKDHGEWYYEKGFLCFYDLYPSSCYAIFRSVHWNWRVLCTQRELTGKGENSYPATPADLITLGDRPRPKESANGTHGGDGRPGSPYVGDKSAKRSVAAAIS
jgi:hypothetical protein